tara:strand:+ start:106568 stop:107572 length:1005 start_codon:yes stop_codon:yes gene_type:complete
LAQCVNLADIAIRDFHLALTISYKLTMMRPGFNPDKATDIRGDSWMVRLAPKAFKPYLHLLRADRPIGTWLLLLPCLWSVTMAAKASGAEMPPAGFVGLFALGAFVMRGAGCVVNDLWDRDIDGQVARTAQRPIASGEIPVRHAVWFLGALLLVGLGVLLQFNAMAVTLGVASLVLIVVYPLMKRITYWPQAFLGLTFNWGALLAWASIAGEVEVPAVAMYVAGFFWTLGYDTVYGHQDKADDILVGVKSSSIKLGRHTRPFVYCVYGLTVLLLAIAGALSGLGWFYFVMLAGGAIQMVWQVSTLKIDQPDNCLARFKSNRDFGLIVFLGALLG